MNHPIPCFLADSDQARLMDTADAMYDKQVEDYTDYLLDECKSADYCQRLIIEYEMIEGCSEIMAEIANWTGRSDDANERMKKLHVLLANALRDVAESEVGA
ncbi:MAG: hypothetical protein ACYCZR_02190 [Burkholderiales bacterium]